MYATRVGFEGSPYRAKMAAVAVAAAHFIRPEALIYELSAAAPAEGTSVSDDTQPGSRA
jgi:hypothetical protein